MKRILILIPLLFLGSISLSTTDLRTVERIIDGDTIVLKGGERVRYIGIDTPEMNPEEPFAKEATRRNAILVDGREVRLEYDEEKTDRYGRSLAYVYVDYNGKELFVNAWLVLNGYARAVRYPPNTKFADLFTANQNKAHDLKRGIWSVEEDHAEHVIPPNGKANNGQALFFTKDGGEYHVAGCRYLLGGFFSIALEEAKKSLDPCSVCKPNGN